MTRKNDKRDRTGTVSIDLEGDNLIKVRYDKKHKGIPIKWTVNEALRMYYKSKQTASISE